MSCLNFAYDTFYKYCYRSRLTSVLSPGDIVSVGGKEKWMPGNGRRCGIDMSWTDGVTCESVKPGSRRVGSKKRQLSGADSAWLLVYSIWSQQAGKSLSDKVESFLSVRKEPAL